MELALPLIGLGGLYVISNQKSAPAAAPPQRRAAAPMEGFRMRTDELPNTNIPDKNYPTAEITNTSLDLTSKYMNVNQYKPTRTATDKYFTTGAPNSTTPATTQQFQSLTGESVGTAHFKHNNMVPFFGSSVRGRTGDSNRFESTLDNYTGAGSQIIKKSEQSPLFKPSENVQHAYGAPNMNDFYQSRANQSMSMNGVKPFQSENVAPAMGAGAGTAGSGGFNSGMEHREAWMPRNVDELRVATNPKATEYGLLGYEGAPMHYITNSANQQSIGIMEKNRPERAFEHGQERYFTTRGLAQSAPLSDQIEIGAEIVEKHMNRTDTLTDYTGNARGANSESYTTGEYMPSHNIQLGEAPLPIATATGRHIARAGDYSLDSNTAYNNNRTSNYATAGGDNYFAGISTGGVIGAVIAPLLDLLRPTRKQNTVGNLRPYENAKSTVGQSYIYNPADRPAPTIREMTEQSKGHYQINRNQDGGAYLSTPHTATETYRTETTTEYSGIAGAYAPHQTSYDANYRQRNNDIKASTIAGHTPSGNMRIFNADVNPTSMRNDAASYNTREIAGNRAPVLPVGVDSYGQLAGHHQSTVSDIGYTRSDPAMVRDMLKKNPYAQSYMGAL